MKDSAFLIFNAQGIVRMVKGRRSKFDTPSRPILRKDEYAVMVSVNVPDKVFKPRAIPVASLVIPEGAVVEPVVDVAVETFEDKSDVR